MTMLKTKKEALSFQEFTRIDWVIFFRRAKTVDTLDKMYERKLRDFEKSLTESKLADLVLAHDHRHSEIIQGKFVSKLF